MAGNERIFPEPLLTPPGSDYFAMCSSLHLPDEPDLVIIEVAINDQVGTHYLVPVELLLRQLLELDSQPAVLVFK